MPENGESPTELDVYDFKGPGIALAMYNVDQVLLHYAWMNDYAISLQAFSSLLYIHSFSVVKFASQFEHLLNHQCQWHFQRNGLFT